MREALTLKTTGGSHRNKKNEGANSLLSDSLLGGGYLRLPMSLTIRVVRLRALCQERDEAGHSRGRTQAAGIKNERRHHC